MYITKQILFKDTYAVRNPVLRPGLPVNSCAFDGDELDTTVHFGIYSNNDIVGCVSVFESASDKFAEENQLQVRGMAVLEAHQKQGLGEQLIATAEKYAAERHVAVLWFNARESAVGFYKKMGYKVKGSEFDIAGVGMHYVMYKILENS